MSDNLAYIFINNFIFNFIFNREFYNKKYFKTNKMSSSLSFNLLRCSVPLRGSQKDTKTPDTKGEKSDNITAYRKSKLSNKPICRKTIKPIKQQLKANGKTIEESLLDLPRFTLYFILHGKVIQEYLWRKSRRFVCFLYSFYPLPFLNTFFLCIQIFLQGGLKTPVY